MTLLPKKRYMELESTLNNLVSPEKLDSKDKKYIASIEKSLTNFDSSIEWADYISFLTRLLKALQSHSKSHWIPHSVQISRCLSKCLSTTLPSGVHRKTLEVYECIFKMLGQALLAQQANLWIPGLLPLMSYASISVKPSLIELFDRYILELPPNYLKILTKALLLSLLPGIDDETSESFDAVMQLIEKLQRNIHDGSHFWQCCFVVIVTSPDRRLGALVWCNKHMPDFTPLDDALSVEAAVAVAQETGLLIRAFCQSLDDDQILVQRGFFDLMISKLKLKSVVLVEKSSSDDVERLIMSACLTVLRKDMSLNRRLWNWLLGTDDSISTPTSSDEKSNSRIQYFTKYGQRYLINGFLKLINSAYLEDRIRGYKVSLAFMDKWEIGILITSEIFVPFLKSVQRSLFESQKVVDNKELAPIGVDNVELNSNYDELFKSASAFFDTIESMTIWSTCFLLIDNIETVAELNANLKLILFIITSFNVNEEDMLTNHLPLLLISLLVLKLDHYGTALDTKTLFEVVTELVDVIPSSIYRMSEPSDEILRDGDEAFNQRLNKFTKDTYQKVKSFYKKGGEAPTDTGPTIFILFTYLVSKSLQIPEECIHFYTYCRLYIDVLEKFPQETNLLSGNNGLNVLVVSKAHSLLDRHQNINVLSSSFDRNLILDYYSLGTSTNLVTESDQCVDDEYVSITFGIATLFSKLVTRTSEKINLLKLAIELLYNVLLLPSNKYQVEATSFLLNLELAVQPEYIESGISALLSKLHYENSFSKIIKVAKILWTGTSATNVIMRRPLYIILDELSRKNSNHLVINDWIDSILHTEDHDRLFNMVTVPLLDFHFLNSNKINLIDDFDIFRYHLETMIHIFEVNQPKVLECVNNEITQIDLIGQDIATYKELLLHVALSFLRLDPGPQNTPAWEIFESESFNRATLSCLKLLSLLLDSTEVNIDDIVGDLIEVSYTSLKNNSSKNVTANTTVDQLVAVQFFDLISSLVHKAHHKNTKLSLFSIDLETPVRRELSGQQLNYIEYLIFSLGYAKNTLVYKHWVSLLVENLLNLSDCIFQVLLPLTEAMCAAVARFFHSIKDQSIEHLSIDNPDQAMEHLLKGLEELLNYSHMYLAASEAKPKPARISNTDPGFLTSVMSGVFSVESPADSGFEETNRYTVLLAFESTVKTCFSIWLWGEQRTHYASKIETKHAELDSAKSTESVASKIKYKSRSFMEKLYLVEPLQVLHTLMANDMTVSLFKILHILDNSRPQLTIPHVFESLNRVLNPDAARGVYKTSYKFGTKQLGRFLVRYLQSLDIAVVEDVYGESLSFLKDVSSTPANYKTALPCILRFVSVLTERVSKTKFGEQKKVRKELCDNFARILSFALSNSATKGTSEQVPLDDGAAVYKETTELDDEALYSNLVAIIPELNNPILMETDRATSAITSVIVNIIQPALKAHKVSEMPHDIMELVAAISALPCRTGNRVWRSLVYDIYTDSGFFHTNINDLYIKTTWSLVVYSWLDDDKDKAGEFVAKLQASNNNSAALFNWSEGETNSKILKVKRMAYVLLISPKDLYLNLLGDLVNKLVELLASSKTELKAQIFVCLRALVVRFSEPHLNQFWNTLYCELEKVFSEFLIQVYHFEEEKNQSADLNDAVDVKSLLAASKLLDLLLTLGFEEFNLNEWVFINDSMDAVSNSLAANNTRPVTVGLIDRISQLNAYKLPLATDTRKVTIRTSNEEEQAREKKPLLYGYHHLDSIELLKPFFDLLSYWNFERIYQLKDPDIAACEEDIFADLFYIE